MLTTLFWLMYFMFSIVWAMASGVVVVLCCLIKDKYQYNYYNSEYRNLPKRLTWLIPLLDDVRCAPEGLFWLMLNLPIVGSFVVCSIVIKILIVPFVLIPVTTKVTQYLSDLVNPYLE